MLRRHTCACRAQWSETFWPLHRQVKLCVVRQPEASGAELAGLRLIVRTGFSPRARHERALP